jgi:hypothetical protein
VDNRSDQPLADVEGGDVAHAEVQVPSMGSPTKDASAGALVAS